MLKYCTVVLLAGLLVSCQQQSDQAVTTNPTLSDTVASIVVDGDYGGYVATDYDSAVLRYAAGQVTIRHFSRSSVLTGTEAIQYDSTGRVVKYRLSNALNAVVVSKSFEYYNADPLPSAMDDTVVTANGPEIGHVHFMDRDVSGPVKEFSFYNRFQYGNNLPVIDQPIVYSSFDKDWRLLMHEVPYNYLSVYAYSAAGDVDSCFTKTVSGDDTYYTAQYTATDNPLAPFAQRVFKNLSNYTVVDNLDNSHYENVLDICYLPSELLAAKIPSRSSMGKSFAEIYDENTFAYINQDGALKEILVTHKEQSSGTVSQTHIRLHY